LIAYIGSPTYLVFSGISYYPKGGWSDLVGIFPTHQAALEFLAGDGREHDWYQIIVLNHTEPTRGEFTPIVSYPK